MADFKLKNNNKNTVKTVEINDNGDFIEINFSDNVFMKKLIEFEASLKQLGSVDLKNFDSSMENIYSSIENLFGESIIPKIFGTKTPSILLIYDFIEQLTPIIESQFGQNLNRSQRREATRR